MWDFFWDFPSTISLPLDDWIDTIVKWIAIEGDAIFDFIGDKLLYLLVRLERGLLWVPWWVVILVFAAAGWRLLGRKMALGVVLSMTLIGALGFWDPAMQTLAIVIAASILAVITGVPIGIVVGRSNILGQIIRPLLDLMQTMPSFVYLIPVLMVFPLGPVPALIATFIYAIPPVIRLTDLGIRQVASDVVEAAHAFGSTSWQLLVRVQLPLAMPTIMAGINQTIMMALSMVVIAAMIGAGGLGSEVLRGIGRLEVGHGFASGISIVVMAVIIDRLTQGLVRQEEPQD
ncbi:MAG: proline/glycine betaine ABC transporter permease [Chloroflexi bacterium]|nr:proline/glycine betaine ABC transporter permease [Chloroflexota bacterium]